MFTVSAENFEQWRQQARQLVLAKVLPEQVVWIPPEEQGLFATELPTAQGQLTAPKNFLPMAEKASCYRDNEKWHTLYRLLWRLQTNKNLLKIATDDDVLKLRRMNKEVHRDYHKMKAFVRFREVGDNEYVAWHQPSHLIVAYTAPFFVRRFENMKWTILTPDASAIWNGEDLTIGAGVPRSEAPAADDMEELWKTFYRHIFNPARIKVKMMKSEMPVKYWHTMPETALIPEMLEEADARVKKMIKDSGNGTLPVQ